MIWGVATDCRMNAKLLTHVNCNAMCARAVGWLLLGWVVAVDARKL
mgnify:CR=1 FL=1